MVSVIFFNKILITKKDIWVYVNYGGYGVTEVENL